MEVGNWNEAITKFNDTIEINPNNPQSYGNLGICYASIGKIQLALESFDRSIELDPDYEPALLNRMIIESLGEGECLGKKVKIIEYYKDYPFKNRSYIQEVAKEQGLLPEKKQIESGGQGIF
jgi:lipoprotein NlpI